MIAGGHLLGYFLGYLDLVKIFGGYLGNTQLKSICVLSSLALLVTVGITSKAVSERVLTTPYGQQRRGILKELSGIFSTLYSTVCNLPPKVSVLLEVQIFSWFGWFSFLFYSSTWVGEVYKKYSDDPLSDDSDAVGSLARVGSMSLMAFSVVSLAFSLILPEIVKKQHKVNVMPRHRDSGIFKRLQKLAFMVTSPLRQFLSRFSWLQYFSFERPDLTTLWLISHINYCIAALSTCLVRSLTQATFVVGLFGFSWAITTWAPFALLAEEIHTLAPRSGSKDIELGSLSMSHPGSRNSSRQVTPSSASHEIHVLPAAQTLRVPINLQSSVSHSREVSLSEEDFYKIEDPIATTGEMSGVYLGIHNVAITIPQLISTFVSFLVFSALEVHPTESLGGEGDGQVVDSHGDGGYAVGVTLQIGGIAALGSAYFTYKLRQMK